MKSLEDYVRNIKDFPKKGIIYRDVTTVLQDKDGLKLALDSMKEKIKDLDFDVIVAPESRGFIFGMPLAYVLNKSFVPVRKKGKLPSKTIEQSYDLEYGSETLQIHEDSILPGQKVVIIDDLLATGGTIEAITKLVETLGGEVVEICSLIELVDLKGREVLKNYKVESCIEFKGE